MGRSPVAAALLVLGCALSGFAQKSEAPPPKSPTESVPTPARSDLNLLGKTDAVKAAGMRMSSSI
jgi:hypothetical protein